MINGLLSILMSLFFTAGIMPAGDLVTTKNEKPIFNDREAFIQPSPDRVPYTLFHDFETGELFGWEPYPYQQDIGYDALYFTRQSPTFNDSKYALARPVRANDTVELYQGFTRRLNMWTTPDTRVQMAVFFQSDRNPDTLELSLGTMEGRRYTHRIENPDANRWVELDIPAGAFELNGESLSSGEHIQVITMKASYPIVYYLFTYTMLLDDFQINGERRRRFAANGNPGSTDFEEFDISVLNKHYYYGDTITLNVSPERGSLVDQVRGTLVNGNGDVVRDNIAFSRRGDGWVNNSIHRVGESDVRGQWEIRLRGRASNGHKVEWGFQFLMPGERVTDHPRLFFSREELDERLANESSSVAQRILDNALSNTTFMDVDIDELNEGQNIPTESFTAGPYGKYSELRRALWRPPMYSLRDVIRDGSFYYAFTGDVAAGEKAKEALLKLCSFENWNAGWMIENQFWTYYPLGYVLQGVAIGYDMLHDLISEEEKQFVRDAIIEKALKMFYRDMVEMNRMPSHATNHLSVLVSGYGMAATAIYGDEPDNPYMEPWLSGILAKMKAFVDHTYYTDGSYAEPMGYHGHATNNIAMFFPVLERNFGLDYSTTTGVRNFYLMPLYGTSADGSLQDFGDFNVGNRFDFTALRSQWFVHRMGDPYLYDYVKPYWELGRGGYLGYLLYREDINPVSRTELPTSRIFEAKGMIMRSGWEDESSIIHTHVGPNSNHYHYDQGSFQIRTNGDELLTDPGIGFGGYYGNLEFPAYNMQAIGHNVMLIDHDPESQAPGHYDNGIAALRDWPRMTHTFNGEIADAIEGDLTTVYKDKLEHYNRTLLYTKSGPLFLFDQVRSVSPEGHIYNWLFHAPQNENGEGGYERALSYEDNRISIDRPNARLTIDVLSPEIRSERIRDRHDERHPESFISLNSRPGLREANFLAVLLPEAQPVNGQYASRPQTVRIEESGWIGARVEYRGAVDIGLFRTSRNAGATVEGFTTDAKRFTASFNKGGVFQKVYVEGSSFFGSGLSISSGLPVTVAVELGSSVRQLEVKAEHSTKLRVSVDGRPAQVLLNGEQVRDWSYDSGSNMLTLQVPEGRTDFTIR